MAKFGRIFYAAFFIAYAVGFSPVFAQDNSAAIDVTDYFFRTDSHLQGQSVLGQNAFLSKDPDGQVTQAYVSTKFSVNTDYEVFTADDQTIRMVYESSRGGKDPSKWYVRRYFNQRADGVADSGGQIWLLRHMVPGGNGYLATHSQKRYKFIPNGDNSKTGHYELDTALSKPVTSYLSVVWGHDDFIKGNETGINFDRVLRLVEEWKDDGSGFENYDYGLHVGLINWRWNEALFNILKHPAPEGDANVYTAGTAVGQHLYVYIEPDSVGSDKTLVAYAYDIKEHKKGRKFQTYKHKTYWLKDREPQWYVVVRDRSLEEPLTMKPKNLQVDFALPEAGGITINQLWKQ